MSESGNKEIKHINKPAGREEWPHLIRIGVMIFVTFAVSILFFFAIFRYEGFAGMWGKVLSAAMPIIIGLALAYLMNPVMLWLERLCRKFLDKKINDAHNTHSCYCVTYCSNSAICNIKCNRFGKSVAGKCFVGYKYYTAWKFRR